MASSDFTPRWPAYLRLPCFVPVPMRSRRDGWTAERQGAFVGWLAETGSVAEAAARAGCSRESAYRLRRRDGARGFVAAWDVAASAGVSGDASGKFTQDELRDAAFGGVVHVVMRRGRFLHCRVEPSNSALVALMRQFIRSGGRKGRAR
ncbi:MAG TPA: hypothetical protein VMQ93_02425 [Novosphingobium sp.]|nr:hypothetical protein [Novosphingobium sp.]